MKLSFSLRHIHKRGFSKGRSFVNFNYKEDYFYCKLHFEALGKMKNLLLSILSLLLLSVGAYAQNAPVLTLTGNQSTDEDVTLSGVSVLFADVDGTDTHTITVVSDEANVSVVGLSGQTTGSTYDLVPVAEWSGTADITVTVTDNGIPALADVETYTLTVNSVNDAPTFTTSAVTAAVQDAPYTYNITTVDIDGDAINVSAPTSPDWLTFTPGAAGSGTGVLSGTPINDDVTGNNSVVLTVTDGTASTNQSFTIVVGDVNDAPTFTSTPGTAATQDAVYTYNVTTEDIDGDDINVSAPTSPDWLTFTPGATGSGTGILSGTPTNDDVGVHDVTIRVNDGTVDVDQVFQITVNNENDPPTFTSIPVLTATQDVAYSYTAVAEDIDGNTLVYTAPVLPTWLTFTAATQVLSGTPANDDVGDTTVTIRVFDGTVSVDQAFFIEVADVNDAPTFSSSPIISTSQGALYEYTASALDIDVDDVLTFTAPVLPGWMTFDEATQVLSGTPGNDEVGDHDVTLTVSDGLLSEDQIFVISVANENDAPTFTSTPDTLATQNTTYLYLAVAEDIDRDGLTFTAPVLPEWLDFNVSAQRLSGTPTNADVGDHDVTIRVFDGTVSADQSFVISVADVNDVPTFISIPLTSALQDAVYTYNLVAEDIDGDTLEYSAPVLPAWLTFTAETQILTGTPANDDVGDHDVTLRIFDETVFVDQDFVITVANENDGPVFTSTPDTTAAEETAYAYTPTVEDIDGDILTFTAPVLPGWLSFNEASHLLSGTPGNDDVGDHNVTIRAFDGTTSVDQFFVIAVSNENDAPTYTSSPATSTLQNAVYSYNLIAEDIDGDVLTFTAPVLPDWLTFISSTQILSGTSGNEDVGNNNVTLRIFDGTVSVDQSFVIRVDNVNDAPDFTSSPLTSVKQGVGYSYTVAAVDGDGDAVTFSAPVLPGWLNFNSSTHVLSATPGIENLGNHSITIRVSDGTLSSDQSFTLTVLYGNSAPTFTSDPATYAQTDIVYAYTITTEDPDGDALVYSAPLLPEWLSFYPSSRLVIGEPGQEDIGSHPITLRISDGTVSAEQRFTITVFKANDPPAFTSIPQSSVLEGIAYSYTATANDIDGDVLTFSAPFLPDWLSFDADAHILSGTPEYDDAGVYNVTLRVSDGNDFVDQDFTITVEENGSVDIVNALLNDDMLLYPNPTDGRFIIELPGAYDADLTLEIFDQTGKLFLQQIFPSHTQIREEYNLNSEPAGIYFIRIYHNSDQTVGKLILH